MLEVLTKTLKDFHLDIWKYGGRVSHGNSPNMINMFSDLYNNPLAAFISCKGQLLILLGTHFDCCTSVTPFFNLLYQLYNYFYKPPEKHEKSKKS